MLLVYLTAVAVSGSIAAVRPSCTPALVVWYGLLIVGGLLEWWWPLVGLLTHVAIVPWIASCLLATGTLEKEMPR